MCVDMRDMLVHAHVIRIPLMRTPLGQERMSSLEGCPHFRGQNVHKCGIWG